MEQQFRGGRYFLPGLAIICSVILLDQYTKWLVIDNLRAATAVHPGFLTWLTSMNKVSYLLNEREVFDHRNLAPFLNLVLVWNQGISFGMLDNQSPSIVQLLIAGPLIIAIGMTIWLALSQEKFTACALGLIVGGALGNVYDRVRFNAVEDFIDVHYDHYHWPAFNVADSCVVAGAGILMLISLLGKEDAKRTT